MKTVQDLANEIVAREGGYVDDPDDPGGATKYGVTLAALRRFGADKSGDGKVTEQDLRRLTRAEAAQIYIRHYYHGPKLDALPEALRPSVFDMYVNAGSNAVIVLQRLLNRMGGNITVDGVIGPETVEAAARAAQAAPDHLADAYGIARRNYYYALADARPASRKYARTRAGGKGGWIRRAEEFISPRYHLSEAQHRARVSKWV